MNQKPHGYVTFVSHAGRDLMNILANVVNGVKTGRVQYPDHLDKIRVDWDNSWGADSDRELDQLVPFSVCKKIRSLISEHNAGRIRSSDADSLFFSTFLDYSDKDKIPENFLRDWSSTKRWFLKHAHLRKKDFDPNAESELFDNFNNLNSYLHVAASSQYERLRSLDEILENTNS